MNTELRCKKCGKKLGADLQGKVTIVCPRCQTFNSYLTKEEVRSSLAIKT